jgi:hypothetical protein
LPQTGRFIPRDDSIQMPTSQNGLSMISRQYLLLLDQFAIQFTALHNLFACALIDYFAVLQDNYAVGMLDCGKPVGDHDGGLVF